MTNYYTLHPQDVGQVELFAFGRLWHVANFIGQIQSRDVGKRVYRRGEPPILQVENDAQFLARLKGAGK